MSDAHYIHKYKFLHGEEYILLLAANAFFRGLLSIEQGLSPLQLSRDHSAKLEELPAVEE
jgi:hypothetical protein